MIYEIRHRLDYRYSIPVYIEAHQAHLTPRSDAFQKLLRFEIRVEPEPSCVTTLIDAVNNPACQFWFSGRANRLSFEAFSRVETLCPNPFNFILHESSVCLPLIYPFAVEINLAHYLNRRGEDRVITEFAAAIAKKSGHETVSFLSELCSEIFREVQYIRRDEGVPMAPVKTLTGKKGSCRDMAVLFMACCRSQGIAARFTSGYVFTKTDVPQKDLHAWAEVYLEGGGWRGYDPSRGIMVSDQHVALASSADPSLVAPVSGTFRSVGAISELQTQVDISLAVQEAGAF